MSFLDKPPCFSYFTCNLARITECCSKQGLGQIVLSLTKGKIKIKLPYLIARATSSICVTLCNFYCSYRHIKTVLTSANKHMSDLIYQMTYYIRNTTSHLLYPLALCTPHTWQQTSCFLLALFTPHTFLTASRGWLD